MSDALNSLGILAVALTGVAMGVVWLFFRPSRYRRGLESISKGPSPAPRFIVWGMILLAVLIAILLILSLRERLYLR